MDLAQACIFFINMVSNQPMTEANHQEAKKAFYFVAPKCEDAIQEAQKKAKKKGE